MNDYTNFDMQLDPKALLDEIKRGEVKSGGDFQNIVWHNLPNDDSDSTWRFLPYFKKKSFFLKIEKHWDIPGVPTKTVTCPRSFIDGTTGKPYPCALCEEQFRLYKMKNRDDADETIMKALRTASSYLANAIDRSNEAKGIGVVSLPYAIYQSLVAFLGNAHFQNFFQVQTGRDIWIKPSYKAGTNVPGKNGKQKRDYTVTPMDVTPITDFSLLEGLYDLETVLGIPTYDTTKGWLQKMLSGDPNAGMEFLTGTLYRQLGDGSQKKSEEKAPELPPTRAYEPTFTPVNKPAVSVQNAPVSNPFGESLESPVPQSCSVPTTQMGDDGFPVCYSVAFNEDNKTCLKCDFAEACETSILKRKRQQRLAAQSAAPETTPAATTAPVVDKQKPVEIDAVQQEMLRILGKA
jgi:hypothetical protein